VDGGEFLGISPDAPVSPSYAPEGRQRAQPAANCCVLAKHPGANSHVHYAWYHRALLPQPVRFSRRMLNAPVGLRLNRMPVMPHIACLTFRCFPVKRVSSDVARSRQSGKERFC